MTIQQIPQMNLHVFLRLPVESVEEAYTLYEDLKALKEIYDKIKISAQVTLPLEPCCGDKKINTV